MDSFDITGEHHIDLDHGVYKQRLSKEGVPLEDPAEKLG